MQIEMPDRLTLTAAQRAVVENTEDSILLLAGAGTGKTGALARRIAFLLERGIAAPEELLCLTFTNRARREMADRIARTAGDAAQRVGIFTMHSFCAFLARSVPPSRTDLAHDASICDEEDARQMIDEVVRVTIGRSAGAHALGILQRFIGMLKESRLADPGLDCQQAVRRLFTQELPALQRICVDDQYRHDPKFMQFLARYGGSISELYDQRLAQSHLLDFTDLLLRARLLLEDPDMIALWRGRYTYIHVDEAQDVSMAEYALVRRLGAGARVLLCGDFNQTIYTWRGSRPDELIAQFEADFQPAHAQLVENFRSPPDLLALYERFLARMGAPFSKEAPGAGLPLRLPATPHLVACMHGSPEEEAQWIYDRILDLDLSDLSDAAVLTRTNRACELLCALLREVPARAGRSVQFMLSDEAHMFRNPKIKLLLAGLTLLVNPQDGESMRRVLLEGTKGIGIATLDALLAVEKQGLGLALSDFSDARTQRTGDYFEPLLLALEAGRVVVFDVESTGTDVFTDEIVQMAAVRLGPDGRVAARFERFLRPKRSVGASEQVHGFSDTFLQERGGDPGEALEAFLAFAKDAVIVGHNVGFDREITRQNLARAGSQSPLDQMFYDTLDLSRRFLRGLPNYKLATLCTHMQVQAQPSHDAMDDILATAELLLVLTRQFVLPGSGRRRTVYGQYAGRFAAFADALAALRGGMPLGLPALLTQTAELVGVDLNERLPGLLMDLARQTCDPAWPPVRQVTAFLETCRLAGGGFDRMARLLGKVAVITAHQAKGCEFAHVFLPGLTDGQFPGWQALKSGDLREEERVFYVALTRARQALYLSWTGMNERGRAQNPSRFLRMLVP